LLGRFIIKGGSCIIERTPSFFVLNTETVIVVLFFRCHKLSFGDLARKSHTLCCDGSSQRTPRFILAANTLATPLGTTVEWQLLQVYHSRSTPPANQEGVITDPKGSKATMVDGAGVQARNAINVAMEDLTEEDRKEVECELKEELVEMQRRKLACFQKTRNGVVKKADTTTASSAKVNSHLSPEDLVHMVDVSVASKYRADLPQFTHVVAEDMRHTIDSFKQDLNSNLPRQVTALVQQINGETQGKRVEASAAAPGPSTPANQGGQGVLANTNQPSQGNNLNV
jgi:hypothetical protein